MKAWTTGFIAVFLMLVSTAAFSADPGTPGVAQVLAPTVAGLKAKTQLPILLPSDLSLPNGEVKGAVISVAAKDHYQVTLYYAMGMGDAGFAGMLAAQGNSGKNQQKLFNVNPVQLADGVQGYFRAVSCGGSCAPANLWWDMKGVRYQVQLKLPSRYSKQKQQDIVTAISDSAILAGPR